MTLILCIGILVTMSGLCVITYQLVLIRIRIEFSAREIAEELSKAIRRERKREEEKG